MKDSTLKICDAAIKADETVTPAERARKLKIIRGEVPALTSENGNGHEPRIYSREEAAKMVGDKTTRYIDQLARRGLLKKFTPKGNRRSIGICGESLRAFIEGN